MENKRVMKALLLATIAVMLTTSFLLSIFSFSEKVEGKMSSETDDFGYYWVDSNEPDPTVAYNWIDATTSGTQISDSWYSSYSYGQVNLPFDFPFYGNTYNTTYVTSKGYISFTDTYVTSYGSSLPNSDSPNNIIAVYWSYPYFYHYSAGVWTMSGTTSDGVKYFVIEWDRGRYSVTYELILYETGLIKMQYKDVQASSSSYSNGKRTTVGIENIDGTIGLTYSYNEEVISNHMAIMFSNNKVEAKSMVLVDGEGPDNHIVLVDYKNYTFNLNVFIGKGVTYFKSLSLFFGGVPSHIDISYSSSSGQLNISSINPAGNYLLVDALNSIYGSSNDGDKNWTFLLQIRFTTLWPEGGNLSAKVMIDTYYAGMGTTIIDDTVFVENHFMFIGAMASYVNRGKGWEYVGQNDWVRDRTPLKFSGQMLVYNITTNSSLFSQVIAPPNSAFYLTLTDENFVVYYDNSSSGRNYEFLLNTGKEGKQKVYQLSVVGIPLLNIMNLPGPYILRVDDDFPTPPSGFIIHADSFRDMRTNVDNDNELYLTWIKSTDQSSGVKGYYLNDTFNLTAPTGTFISADKNRYIWNRTSPGEYSIFLWVEDNVGHLSKPQRAKILIDLEPTQFSDFKTSPVGENKWVKSTTPSCSIKVKDFGGSGVFGDSIEYQYSPQGVENLTDWIPADLFGVKDEFSVEVHPQFLDGINNYIKFRAKDFAGNGYTYSELFNIPVDSQPVGFKDIFPGESVWWPTPSVVVNVTVFDLTSGVDLNSIYYRYSINNGDNWTDWIKYSPPSSLVFKDGREVRISTQLDFLEGDSNLIQYKATDNAGNGVIYSNKYIIKIDTKPEVVISSPRNNRIFMDKDKITFDASKTSDYDGDSLVFTWYDNDKFLSEKETFEKILPVGDHNIRLEVFDGFHRITRILSIKVNRTELPPAGVDSDGDGIDDRDEIIYHLDPNNPHDANIDSDGDGFTNLEEVNVYHTDPLNRDSHPNPEKSTTPPPTKEPFMSLLGIIIFVVLGIIAFALVISMYSMMLKKREREELIAEQEEDNMLLPENIQALLPPVVPPTQEALPSEGATTPPPEGESVGTSEQVSTPQPEETPTETSPETPSTEQPPQQ